MLRRSFLALLAVAACGRPPHGPAPHAEFMVAIADSTFWVTSDARGIRMRGAPLILARVDDRFQELYVADDDRSYYDAVLVGQRVFRRDLISGDSTELLSDGEVSELADRFAREHPDDRPLGPDEEGTERPRTYAVAELRLLGVQGPYASYEHRTDIDITGGTSRHAAHRGVIDLRDAAELTVGDLFGSPEGERADSVAGRAWQAVRDSLLLAAGTTRGDAALKALEYFAFNAASFTLGAADRRPLVTYAVPGSGGRAGGLTLPLPSIPVATPSWWRDVREGLPLGTGVLLRWPRERFELVTRTDSAGGDRATLALRDGVREWPVGVVQGPVRRVYWLDAPAISIETRKALARAFDAAALYSDQTRIVRAPTRTVRPGFVVREAARRTAPDAAPHRSLASARLALRVRERPAAVR